VWARLACGGIAVEGGLGLRGVFGKEGQEEIVRLDSLPARKGVIKGSVNGNAI